MSNLTDRTIQMFLSKGQDNGLREFELDIVRCLLKLKDFEKTTKDKEAELLEHAPFSPSAAYRWLKCPGSVKFIQGMPDTTSAAAKEGTLFHEIIANMFGRNLSTYEDYAESMTEDNEEMRKYLLSTFNTVSAFPEDVFLIEHRVELSKDCWGTADLIMWDPETESLRIVDFKYGFMEVQAEENTQLAIYAAATAKLFASLGIKPKTIRATIIQPRIEDSIKTTTFHEIDLANIRRSVQLAEELLDTGMAYLEAGDHCIFCPAIAKCPAYMHSIIKEADAVFGDNFQCSLDDELSLDLISDKLSKYQALKKWATSAQAYVKERLIKGEHASSHFLSASGRIIRKK